MHDVCISLKADEVSLGKEYGNQRIILKGLEPGDRVIVNGLQHIKAGQIVKTVETKEL